MKPSSRVIEILHGLQMENNSDIEIDFLRFHSVLQYLDEQAESQEPKALEEKCHAMCYSTKPQEALEERCWNCGSTGEVMPGELCQNGNCPSLKTKPHEEKFLMYLSIEPPAIIEGGHSYYLKEEILKAFRQFIKSQE